MMQIHKILPTTKAEGPGLRFTIWCQGCTLGCPGCYSKQLWDVHGGYPCSAPDLIAQIQAVKSEIEGITLLGGEPFLQAEELAAIAQYAQENGLSVVTFSGFLLEDLNARDDQHIQSLLQHTDVLIDGPYIQEQRDFSRPLVGSRNQTFHFLTARYGDTDFATYKNRFEIRLDKRGVISINGMGNLDRLEQSVLNNITKEVTQYEPKL